jgi:hypothetical protein
MNSSFIQTNVMATSQRPLSKLHQHNEYTMFNHEIAYDEGKDDDTPAIIVHDGEEDIVPSLTTTLTTKNLHQQDIVMNGLKLHDGSQQGRDENVANVSTETAPSELSESESETTDLEGEVVPETTAVTQNAALDKKASEEVYQFKVIVALILLVSAVVVAAFVHIYVNKKEQSQFAEKFRTDAVKVLDTVGNSIDRTLIPMDSLAVDLVSYARATNATWPCVTLPNFALRMSKALPQTDAMVIQFLPIVKPSQRKKWEHYISQNCFWLNESMAVQETWDGYYGPIGYDWKEKILFGATMVILKQR